MAESQQLIKKNLEYINILPSWAQDLSVKYCSKTANLYFVHGNIRDFMPHKMNEGEFMFVRIQEYISEVLFGNRDIIVFYDKSSGVTFCMSQMEKDYLKTMTARYPNVDPEDFFSKDPQKSFSWLEKYFVLNIPRDVRIV